MKNKKTKEDQLVRRHLISSKRGVKKKKLLILQPFDN